MSLRRVVVTGLGAITPVGKTAPAYWEGLVAGRSGAAPITRFDAGKFKTRFACEVKDYNPDDYFDRKEGRKMDIFTQFGLIAANEAIADARLMAKTACRQGPGGRYLGLGHRRAHAPCRPSALPSPTATGRRASTPFFIPKMIADSVVGQHFHPPQRLPGP